MPVPSAPAALPDSPHLGVIGLGYVGLPLAVAFGELVPTVGFDIDPERIAALRQGHDHTREVEPAQLQAARHLQLSADATDLAGCNVYIVTVPTPIDAARRPDFGPLLAACDTVGRVLARGNVVIFESTVYPGATEEVCVPRLEEVSGLRLNRDFHCGYSPERINPGDREHRLGNVVKVVSGSNPAAAEFVEALYRRIVQAGTHRTSSIRVAEAAKVIENTQRDLNIALVNELAQLCARLGIDTTEVLEAAGTKWNFLPFRPGLVGGHCIGVDPYYLTHKAQQIGFHPAVILAGRRINDGMGEHVAMRVLRLMARRGLDLAHARALILGLSFKENCPDLRNTRVIDLIATLREFGVAVEVHDPLVDPAQARREYGLALNPSPPEGGFDAVVLAVAHRPFVEAGPAIRRLCREGGVLFDVKSVLPRDIVDERL